jgi:hypothetical protein
MDRTPIPVALAAALALLLGPAPVAATTPDACQLAINRLLLQTQDASYARDGGEAAKSQLASHLSNTKAALYKRDVQAALKHMDSYSNDLSRAVRSRAISGDEAPALQEGGNGVVACIVAIAP